MKNDIIKQWHMRMKCGDVEWNGGPTLEVRIEGNRVTIMTLVSEL